MSRTPPGDAPRQSNNTDLYGMGPRLRSAIAARQLGHLDESRGLLTAIIAQRREQLGETHAETTAAMSQLGRTLRVAGDFAEARRLHEQVLSIRQEAMGHHHPYALNSLVILAETLLMAREGHAIPALLTDALGDNAAAWGTLPTSIDEKTEFPPIGRIFDALAPIDDDDDDDAGRARRDAGMAATTPEAWESWLSDLVHPGEVDQILNEAMVDRDLTELDAFLRDLRQSEDQ